MALDFPSNPVDRQVSGNFYWDAASTAWRNVGSKNGLSTRVTSLETANASTNMAGLVPVIPSSVAVGSGSASVSASGKVTYTGASTIQLNGVFTSSYERYCVILTQKSISANSTIQFRWANGGTPASAALWYGSGYYYGLSGNGNQTPWSTAGDVPMMYQLSSGYDSTIATASIDVFMSTLGSRVIVQTSSFPNGAGGSTLMSLFNQLSFYDGIKFSNSPTATMTGALQVYGYRN